MMHLDLTDLKKISELISNIVWYEEAAYGYEYELVNFAADVARLKEYGLNYDAGAPFGN